MARLRGRCHMVTKIPTAGNERAGNNSGYLCQEPRIYSLDAIIALQKVLANGIPEELVKYLSSSPSPSSFPRERRGVSDRRKAPLLGVQSNNSSLLTRMLRRLFRAMQRSAETSGDGSYVHNAW